MKYEKEAPAEPMSLIEKYDIGIFNNATLKVINA
jgi:hypothetical protein